jgi:hypothetical protein
MAGTDSNFDHKPRMHKVFVRARFGSYPQSYPQWGGATPLFCGLSGIARLASRGAPACAPHPAAEASGGLMGFILTS